MKKITTLMTLALLAVLSLSFTSCDDDDAIAYTLEGTWRGDMYVSSECNGRTYDATYSEICFLRDPYRYSSGTGYWVDHYSNSGWGRNYVASHIDWRVYNGCIEVVFLDEYVDGLNPIIYIEDYRLSDSYFEGTIYDGYNRVDFRLYHVSSPNWNDYYYGWDTYYYYSKENNTWTRANKDAEPVAAPKRIFRTNK